MLKITISGINEIKRDLERMQKKMRDDAKKALNNTAFSVKKKLDENIVESFDNPVPFTKRAIGVEQATRENLKARVFIRDPQLKYLREHVEGGARPAKASERRFTRDTGAAKSFWVPGAGIKLNRFGNLSIAAVKSIAAKLNARGAYAGSVFFGQPKGMPPGIYARRGRGKRVTGVIPLLIQVDQPRYRKRFKFYEVAEQAASSELSRQMNRALAETIRVMR
jgi:hypothetical protein